MEEKDQILMQEVTKYVSSIGKWYRFFGIMSIIGAAFMFLSGIVMLLSSSAIQYYTHYDNFGMYSYGSETIASFVSSIMGIVYILGTGLVIPVAVFLLRGASAASRSIDLQDNEQAVLFLKNTKSYWKFSGILTIVTLSLCILMVFVAIFVAAATAASI